MSSFCDKIIPINTRHNSSIFILTPFAPPSIQYKRSCICIAVDHIQVACNHPPLAKLLILQEELPSTVKQLSLGVLCVPPSTHPHTQLHTCTQLNASLQHRLKQWIPQMVLFYHRTGIIIKPKPLWPIISSASSGSTRRLWNSCWPGSGRSRYQRRD